MQKFIAFSLLILYQKLSSAQQPQTDLSVVISKKALDFLLGETQNVLNRQLSTLQLPSGSQEFSGGSVSITNVALTKFVSPTYFYDLEPPHTLVWGLNDSSLSVSGQWAGRMYTQSLGLIPWLQGSGGFEADLDQLSLLLRAQLGKNDSSGVTKIDNFQCNATINNLTTRANGGVVGYVLRVFQTTVASKVKPILEQAICSQMENLFDEDVDQDLLQNLPTKYDVGRKFVLAVSLINAPTVDRQVGFVQLDHQVHVQYDGGDETQAFLAAGNASAGLGGTPLAPPLDRMLYVRMSENPANMLLFTMHRKNMTSFIIDEHTSQQTSDYLRLSCSASENCLGHSMEGIATLYPPTAKGAFRVYTSRPPTIRFNDGSAELSVPAILEINIRPGPPKYDEENLLISDINMAATVHLSVDKDGKKIIGDWNVHDFALTVRNTGLLGSVVKIDNQKLGDSLKSFVVDQGSGMLSAGVDVPIAATFVPGYTLTNLNLRLLQKVMQFEADLTAQQAFKSNF